MKFGKEHFYSFIIALIIATSVYFVLDAYFFVQRSHARVDSIVNLLQSQEYEVIEKSLAYGPETIIDCAGDEGVFLGHLYNANVTTVYFTKTITGAYMWFERDVNTIVYVGHILW